jgi:hypothetical protein
MNDLLGSVRPKEGLSPVYAEQDADVEMGEVGGSSHPMVRVPRLLYTSWELHVCDMEHDKLLFFLQLLLLKCKCGG